MPAEVMGHTSASCLVFEHRSSSMAACSDPALTRCERGIDRLWGKKVIRIWLESEVEAEKRVGKNAVVRGRYRALLEAESYQRDHCYAKCNDKQTAGSRDTMMI